MPNPSQVPVGPWAKDRKLKELGYLMLLHCLEGIEAFTLAPFSRILMWSNDEIYDLMNGVKSELMNPKNHLYCVIHFVYGRKPGAQ